MEGGQLGTYPVEFAGRLDQSDNRGTTEVGEPAGLTRQPSLEAAVPASEIARVQVGQKLEFRVDGFGERPFVGRIERINPATVAGSRSINVYAVIDNADGVLRAGMFAQGAASLERIAGALFVPASALRDEGGKRFVYALSGGRVVRRPVKIGAPDPAGWVQVREGLAAGERIVRNNLGALREGASARVAGV